jgi:hypothetical protein
VGTMWAIKISSERSSRAGRGRPSRAPCTAAPAPGEPRHALQRPHDPQRDNLRPSRSPNCSAARPNSTQPSTSRRAMLRLLSRRSSLSRIPRSHRWIQSRTFHQGRRHIRRELPAITPGRAISKSTLR